MARGLRYVYVGNVPGHAGNHTYCPQLPGARHHEAGLLRARVDDEERALRLVRLRDCRRLVVRASRNGVVTEEASVRLRIVRGCRHHRCGRVRRRRAPGGRPGAAGDQAAGVRRAVLSRRRRRHGCARRSKGSCGMRCRPASTQPVAMVVPHAGYIFSGQIAADAYRQVAALAGRCRRHPRHESHERHVPTGVGLRRRGLPHAAGSGPGGPRARGGAREGRRRRVRRDAP